MTISACTHKKLEKAAEIAAGGTLLFLGLKEINSLTKTQTIAKSNLANSEDTKNATDAAAEQKPLIAKPVPFTTYAKIGVEVLGGIALVVHGIIK